MSPNPYVLSPGRRGGYRRATHLRAAPGAMRTWCGKLVTLTSKVVEGADHASCKLCVEAYHRAWDADCIARENARARLHFLGKLAYETLNAPHPEALPFKLIDNAERERWLDVVRAYDLYSAREDK